MGVLKNNRGFLRLIEMALAATLIIAFLIFIQQMQSSILSSPSSSDTAVLRSIGEGALRSLDLRDNDSDGQSDLRQRLNCNGGRWDKIETDMLFFLPPNVGFILSSVDETGAFSYKGGASAGTEPKKGEAVAVTYVVAGEYGNYSDTRKPCNIRLLLWFNK